jgi:hypothetical protein
VCLPEFVAGTFFADSINDDFPFTIQPGFVSNFVG